MTRFVSVTVLMVVLAASRVAGADKAGTPTGMLPGNAGITFAELRIHENNASILERPKVTPDSEWRYFNLAHCECAAPDAEIPADFVYHADEFSYLVKLTTSSNESINRPLNFLVGTDCTNENTRDQTCSGIPGGLNNIDVLRGSSNFSLNVPLFEFMVPKGATKCDPTMPPRDSTVWAIVDTNGDGKPDYYSPHQITTDIQPPALPAGIRAFATENGIQLSWDAPADTSDIYAYQALCARASDDAPGKTTGRPGPRFDTSETVCRSKKFRQAMVGLDVPAPSDEDRPVTLSEALLSFNRDYLCQEDTSPTSTGFIINGLQNDEQYKVVLLVMDKFGNVNGTYFKTTVTPRPAIDLWEDLHDRGSSVEGGLCLLAETYGGDSGLTHALRAFRDETLRGSLLGRWLIDAYYATLGELGGLVHGSLALRIVAAVVLAPLVVLALAWHWLTLPGLIGLIAAAWLWHLRRRWIMRVLQARWVRAAVAVAVVVVGAHRAYAQGGYQPYWENAAAPASEQQLAPNDPGLVSWHVGVRVGPYVPDIDNQLNMHPGPYEQMFGNFRLLPMLDVDRILWTGYGQVGVGFSGGYLQRTARTFKADSMPDDPDRERERAARNAFRLIPLALTGTYRFTMLDDEYGVPIVPYVRAGLAYYIWWIKAPSGGYSRVCRSGTDPACDKDKALGASLGVTGSIGIAVRAERIDKSAAISMQSSGIQHAGLYAELSLAQVDGFGSDTKLSVGDRTWFAGIDFEF